MSVQTAEKNVLHIPDHTGDTRFMWDPRVQDEVDTARDAFNNALAKGMTAYKVDPNSGEKSGEIVREFDPSAGKIIMVKQLQGG